MSYDPTTGTCTIDGKQYTNYQGTFEDVKILITLYLQNLGGLACADVDSVLRIKNATAITPYLNLLICFLLKDFLMDEL